MHEVFKNEQNFKNIMTKIDIFLKESINRYTDIYT